LKILFTSNRFHPDIGGIESVSDILTQSFVSAGHSLRLVTQTPGDLHEDLRLFPFPVLRRPSSRELLASYRWSDAVFQNNLELRQLWPLLLCRRPLLIALHTWNRSTTGQRALLHRFKRLVLHAANSVVAVSDAIRADSFPSATVIGNPYSSQLFRVLPEIYRERSIVFLGRLVSDKGIEMLLQAFAQLRPTGWRLTIIGDGPERGELELLATELDISDSVKFSGSLQGETLVHELNRHELMVVPSRWREPFGVVALEGLASGCVVLASDGGGLPDAVGSAGLLFRRGDLADLTRRLRELIDNGDLRAHLRHQAPSHLVRFEKANVCSQYLSLVEGLRRQPSQLLY
jgi:glycosyltransferase involved in cell wall biosynthesis